MVKHLYLLESNSFSGCSFLRLDKPQIRVASISPQNCGGSNTWLINQRALAMGLQDTSLRGPTLSSCTAAGRIACSLHFCIEVILARAGEGIFDKQASTQSSYLFREGYLDGTNTIHLFRDGQLQPGLTYSQKTELTFGSIRGNTDWRFIFFT